MFLTEVWFLKAEIQSQFRCVGVKTGNYDVMIRPCWVFKGNDPTGNHKVSLRLSLNSQLQFQVKLSVSILSDSV